MAILEVKQVRPGIFNIYSKCPFCQRNSEPVQVTAEAFHSWRNGMLIQRAFPELSPSQRELIKTGVCDDCFPKEEDDE